MVGGGVRSSDYQNFLGWLDLVTHGSPLAGASRARELHYQSYVPLQHSSVTDPVKTYPLVYLMPGSDDELFMSRT